MVRAQLLGLSSKLEVESPKSEFQSLKLKAESSKSFAVPNPLPRTHDFGAFPQVLQGSKGMQRGLPAQIGVGTTEDVARGM